MSYVNYLSCSCEIDPKNGQIAREQKIRHRELDSNGMKKSQKIFRLNLFQADITLVLGDSTENVRRNFYKKQIEWALKL